MIRSIDITPGAVADYRDWYSSSFHGDTLLYWVGDLQFDRQNLPPGKTPEELQERFRLEILDVLAKLIVDDAKNGVVTLTQRKLGEYVYEYRAHRVRPDRVRYSPAKQLIET